MSATSSIAAGFETAAAVESVITEEAYTIDIKTIVVKMEAMVVAKLELRESMIQLWPGFYQLVMDTLCFSSRGGEDESASMRTLVSERYGGTTDEDEEVD